MFGGACVNSVVVGGVSCELFFFFGGGALSLMHCRLGPGADEGTAHTFPNNGRERL